MVFAGFFIYKSYLFYVVSNIIVIQQLSNSSSSPIQLASRARNDFNLMHGIGTPGQPRRANYNGAKTFMKLDYKFDIGIHYSCYDFIAM